MWGFRFSPSLQTEEQLLISLYFPRKFLCLPPLAQEIVRKRNKTKVHQGEGDAIVIRLICTQSASKCHRLV
jgi:hypothetical protein